MTERIKGVGPRHAKMALVGEAYGASEKKEGRPFVGKAGYELDRLLHSCGIKREELYITNVVNEQPPNNDFSIYYHKGKPTQKLKELHVGLRSELAMLPMLEKVVCLGKEATFALTGGGTELNGYWTPAQFKDGVWVLPTYHPASIFRAVKIKETDGSTSTYNTRQIIAYHLMKATGNPKYDEHKTRIYPQSIPWKLQAGDAVAVDIEVINKKVVCIGVCRDGHTGYCVDVRPESDTDPIVMRWVIDLLKDPTIFKLFHSAPYDIPWLSLTLDMEVNNFWDTMVLQKSLFPDMPKSLEFCAGMHCNLPYWKGDLKTATSTVKGNIDWDQLFTYNCMDVIATLKVFNSQTEYAGDRFPHLQDDKKLMEVVMKDMILGGINVNFSGMMEELVIKEIESRGIKEELDEKFGCNVNSAPQLGEYALKAGLLGKNPKLTDTGRIKMDKGVLEKLAETDELFGEIMEWKGMDKDISNYYKPTPDPDGKWHCTFNVLTKTGRFTSSSSAFGHGYNLQNVPASMRHLFIPTEGCRFCTIDLNSGDNTVFAAITGDVQELELIVSGANVHTAHATQLFGKSEEEITEQDEEMQAINNKNKSWRQMAKKMCHAVNYGAQYTTVATTLGIKRAAAKGLMTQWFQAHPQIRQYHEWVANQLRTKGYLVTPLGRRREFIMAEGERVLEDAIAYVPQSTCTGILNMGWLRLREVVPPTVIRAVIQEHDGILYEYDTSVLTEKEVWEMLQNAHVFPVDIKCPLDNITTTIEIGVKVKFGDTWKEAS